MSKLNDNEKIVEIIDTEEIKKLIPHRFPFLFIDKVNVVVLGKSAEGIKNVTINEPFFQGHFPNQPIMPGVLIVEALAQTAAVLVSRTLNSIDNGRLVYFMSINNTKFRKLVKPGDNLSLRVNVIQNRRNIWRFRGEAFVLTEIVTEADFTAMMVDPNTVKSKL